MFTLVLMLSALFTSCEKVRGEGEVVTETRNTGAFTGISLGIDGNVYFTTGKEYSVKVSGQANVIRHIETVVDGGSLVIKLEKGVILGRHETIKVYISAPDVASLEVSGSGNIYADNSWTGEDLNVNISGSGNISMTYVEADHFNARISGSGSISSINGMLGTADLRISGSGSIDFRNVKSTAVYSTTGGSGDTYVYPLQILDVTISGSGNVYYNGSPSVNANIAGSGKVRKL